jgi:heme/copper-type cytochrome/quinol oxidase subunit 2
MRGTVIVEPEADYQAWLAQQRTFAELSAPAKRAAAEQKASIPIASRGSDPGTGGEAR